MSIHLWKYLENKKNYPGYHITADKEGCRALLKQLDVDTQKEFGIVLNPVDKMALKVPNNMGGKAEYEEYSKLIITVKEVSNKDRKLFNISDNSPCLTITLSNDQKRNLVKGIKDISNGWGDYSIGPGRDNLLFFWWYYK